MAENEEDGTLGVYEAVRLEGQRELGRPMTSLWWSGIAAGTCMSMSVLATALLELHLPEDMLAAPLLSHAGYVVGFLIVVLGRMQLFTENTITTVFPALANPRCIGAVARLWALVLGANLVGAAAAAVLLAHTGQVTPEQLAAMHAVADHATGGTFAHHLGAGVPAGFLIAAVVWTAAAAPEARFWIVAALTYVIALGEFSHVIAGAVEVFLLVALDGVSALPRIGTFIVPALLGNIIGGTVLFALIAYAQVREELDDVPVDDGLGRDDGEPMPTSRPVP